jgi:hypothetical protein
MKIQEQKHENGTRSMLFECPGCDMLHVVHVDGSGHPVWSWNVTLYDNNAAAGNILWTGTVAAGQIVQLPRGRRCVNGCYVAIGGTSASIEVYRK